MASSRSLEVLRQIIGHSRWTLLEANTLAEASAILGEDAGVVVLCESGLPDGTWRELLDHTTGLPQPPPLIVAASHADDYLWMEVLNSGGYNVIAKPFEEQEVFQVLSMAWLHRRERGHEVVRRAAG